MTNTQNVRTDLTVYHKQCEHTMHRPTTALSRVKVNMVNYYNKKKKIKNWDYSGETSTYEEFCP